MRQKNRWYQILIFCCSFCFLSSFSSEQFTETLLITPLPNGDLFSLFNFTVLAQANHGAATRRPVLVPRLLQNLANQFDLTDLQLSLTQGFWRPRLWGFQLPGTEVPSGNQLIAKLGINLRSNISRSENDRVDEPKWSGLVHTINGLFCASLLQLVPQLSSNPKLIIKTGGAFFSDQRWFWGTLGGESVCTENIKAWKNLLPCKQNGFISLIDPIQILSAKFHAVSLKLTRSDDNQWHFAMFFLTVHNGEMSREKAQKGISLIHNLFGHKLTTKCPIVDKDSIIVAKNNIFAINLSKNFSENKKTNFVEFNNLQQINEIFDYRLKSPNFHDQMNAKNILVHSHIKSVNQIGGRICTQIVNPWPFQLTNSLFAHQIPWHLRIFLHTLNVKCRTPRGLQKPNFELSSFTLARDRGRPLLIELSIDIPAMSKCIVNIDYECAFSRIADFPPDASSGIFVPGILLQVPIAHNPMLVKVMSEKISFPLDIHNDQTIQVFGEPLLVLLPIPDFSMPFNVICLVCTAIAIYYGNAIALSTKIMIPVPKTHSVSTTIVRLGILARLHSRIATAFGRIYQIVRRRPKDMKDD